MLPIQWVCTAAEKAKAKATALFMEAVSRPVLLAKGVSSKGTLGNDKEFELRKHEEPLQTFDQRTVMMITVI